MLIFTVAAAAARQTLIPASLMARVTSVFYLARSRDSATRATRRRTTFIVGGTGLATSVILLSRTVNGIDLRMR